MRHSPYHTLSGQKASQCSYALTCRASGIGQRLMQQAAGRSPLSTTRLAALSLLVRHHRREVFRGIHLDTTIQTRTRTCHLPVQSQRTSCCLYHGTVSEAVIPPPTKARSRSNRSTTAAQEGRERGSVGLPSNHMTSKPSL